MTHETSPSSNTGAGAENVVARAWAEVITIPTYGIGAPDRNPMFLEKRVYQGSSGAVYPHPVIDRVFDEKQDKQYTAVFLENRYVKIMVLPELGGRVQMALDKTNGYHFIYHNRVIKPALVGLTGPWISGGIEFNWPQHHRPSTFDAVDWSIDKNADGSVTVHCSEVERMFRTKGMHSFTLHPDRAYLQIDAQLYNRSSEPQTFLWWANPAVHVNDDYQSIFPPDVHAVMDHGKRDVSSFPIATGTYYKVDYSPGTDISRYKNIPVPTSYMAYKSDFDFVGDYDHGRQAGMMHVADHHIVPGKKQWTWGHAGFGQAWDRQLTDDDGPYIELMCGAFTDNQPDFSWLQPGEEKRFTQIFMPYKHIGGAKNANADAVINLDLRSDAGANIADFGVYVTRARRVRVRLNAAGATLYDAEHDLSPEHTLQASAPLPAAYAPEKITLSVHDGDEEIITFTPLPPSNEAPPQPATPARAPAEIESSDELFINGQHLEQYRHATYAPEPYYLEALRRDPLDARCNNALGLLLLRRGRFAEAEPYFRSAIARLTSRNPNPYDGEAYYNLGLALKFQGRFDEAYDAFFKAAWNDAWQSAAYFELARIAALRGRYRQALDHAAYALTKNQRHHKARHLRIALLRRLGRSDAARAECAEALHFDPLEPGALWEQRALQDGDGFVRSLRRDVHTLLELARDFLHAGLHDAAIAVLAEAPQSDPLVHYTAALVHTRRGDDAAAAAACRLARACPPEYCFPNTIEDVLVLENAMRIDASDPRAPYYLGNFWYAHRRADEAIACWERAASLDPAFPTAWRNLGLAYFNKRSDAERAVAAYARAFACDPHDARVLFELDQLAHKRNTSPAERAALLAQHLPLVRRRDDLCVEYVGLLNTLGRHAEALDELAAHTFHPWEGGEGKSPAQYVAALVGLAQQATARSAHAEAAALLERAREWPLNLGEGKLPGTLENNVLYLLGNAHRALGDEAKAREYYEAATQGLAEPTSAMYYNDQPPDMIFYQGLAHAALGHAAEARRIFNRLIEYGETHLTDVVQMDYFAVSLPTFLVFDEDLDERNRIHCRHMMELGRRGLGRE